MSDSLSFETLMAQYRTLCGYCDTVFNRALDALRPHIRCARGCSACCVLETVAPLEASVIADYVQTVSRPDNAPDDSSHCVLLHQDTCTIYPARPIICRTHGVPLLYPSSGEIEICPLNLTRYDVAALPHDLFCDAERIADNLMRLNLAFCMLTGQQDVAGTRIPLKRLCRETRDKAREGIDL